MISRAIKYIRFFFLGSIGFGMVFFSCTPKIGDVSLPYDTLQQFSSSGDNNLAERWWTTFDDQQLNRLVDTAIRRNLPLRSSWQQIIAAQATIKQAKSGLIPQIDVGLQSGISRPKPDFVGGENTQLSLGADYEVDLWGRIRYGVEAEQYRGQATKFDYKAATISLSAELTITWLQLLAAKEQLALLQDQIATNEQTLRLIRNRFSTGQVRGVDLLRQRQLIASTKEQKIVLETNVGLLSNQLAILLGYNPGTFNTDTLQSSLPGLPSLPDTGIPLELVNRRPDIQSAYYQLQAADREMAAAISAKYPRLSLSMVAAIRSNDINNLLQSQAVSLSGGILAPIFYGGRLRAAVDEAEAIREQRINDYSQAVLTAFQEIENALIQEQKQLERIEMVEEQLDLAQRSNQQLKIEYLNGTGEYLDVLNGLNQEQQLQRGLINARLDLLAIRVSLYRALAGGFETFHEQEQELNQ